MNLGEWIIHFIDIENNASEQKMASFTDQSSQAEIKAARDDQEMIIPRVVRHAYISYFRGLFIENGYPWLTGCVSAWVPYVPASPVAVSAPVVNTAFGFRLRNYHALESDPRLTPDAIKAYLRQGISEFGVDSVSSAICQNRGKKFWENMFRLGFDFLQTYCDIGIIDTEICDDVFYNQALNKEQKFSKLDAYGHNLNLVDEDPSESSSYTRNRLYLSNIADPNNETFLDLTLTTFWDTVLAQAATLPAALAASPTPEAQTQIIMNFRQFVWSTFGSVFQGWIALLQFTQSPRSSTPITTIGGDFQPLVCMGVSNMIYPPLSREPATAYDMLTPTAMTMSLQILEVPDELEFNE